MGVLSWFVSGGLTAAADAVGRVAAPISNVMVAKERTKTDTHRVDVEAAKEVAIADGQISLGFGQLQAKLALADSAWLATRLMRPTLFYVCLYYFVCFVIQNTQPAIARALLIDATDLPTMWGALVIGVLGSVFALRTFEKDRRLTAVTSAPR